jgi:hypothetical protein
MCGWRYEPWGADPDDAGAGGEPHILDEVSVDDLPGGLGPRPARLRGARGRARRRAARLRDRLRRRRGGDAPLRDCSGCGVRGGVEEFGGVSAEER